jgi:hypothetical protein
LDSSGRQAVAGEDRGVFRPFRRIKHQPETGGQRTVERHELRRGTAVGSAGAEKIGGSAA